MKIKAKDANEEVIEIEEHDSASVELTEEELASLKKLLPVADKLLALLPSDTEDDETEVEDEEELEDSDEENRKLGDSFESIGAVHNKKQSLNDSESLELAVDNAWSKRYGGKV